GAPHLGLTIHQRMTGFEETQMRFIEASRVLATVVVLAACAPAAAINCYMIVDRNNDVIYQDTIAPIDLSDEGAAAREALRRQGQQLIALDVERCPAIDRARVAGKGGPATVEEIVAGMRSAVPFGTAAGG